MSLLDRIAHSDGDPQRTITALRLINERQEQELRQRLGHLPAKTEVRHSGLSVRLHLAIKPVDSHRSRAAATHGLPSFTVAPAERNSERAERADLHTLGTHRPVAVESR